MSVCLNVCVSVCLGDFISRVCLCVCVCRSTTYVELLVCKVGVTPPNLSVEQLQTGAVRFAIHMVTCFTYCLLLSIIDIVSLGDLTQAAWRRTTTIVRQITVAK